MPDAEEQQGAQGEPPKADGAAPSPAAADAEQPAPTPAEPVAPAPAREPGAAGEAPPGSAPASAELIAEAAPPPSPAPKPAAERPARPAREAESKEAPRVAPPAGSINEALAAAVPGVEMKAYLVPAMLGEAVAVEVKREDVPAVLTAARDDPRLGLGYMRCLSGVDWQDEGLEVVYHLLSVEDASKQLTVKTRVTYEDAVVPSVAHIYAAADWHERETRDMFGIVFEGHPDLVPLLLPEDMTDHFPLRKENPLQEIEEWQGDNLREGAGEDDE